MEKTPLKKPKRSWRYAGPWLGIATAPAALMMGGGVAQETPLDAIPIVVGIGAIVVWILSTCQGTLGAKHRKPLVELVRPVLGTAVARWTSSVLIALMMLGWAGFCAGVAGGSLAQLLSIPELAGFIIWAVLILGLLLSGIHFGSLIALVGGMATLLLIGWSLVQIGNLDQTAQQVYSSGTIFAGLSLIIGYGSAFSLRSGDFTQAIDHRHVVWISLFGLAIPLALVCLAGAWLYSFAGTWDLRLLLNQLGFPILAHVFIVIGFLGAGFSNLHSGSLALEDLLRCKRTIGLSIVSVASVVLALLDFEQGMVGWFQLLSVVVVPLMGVMLTHYFLKIEREVQVNVVGLIAWAAGATAGVVTPNSLPKVLVGIIIAALVYGLASLWVTKGEVSSK